MNNIFPKSVAYNRFTELENTVVIPFILFVMRFCMGKCTEISVFICTRSLKVSLSKVSVNDREPLKNKTFVEQLFGNLAGDKGYISKDSSQSCLSMVFRSLQN